MGDYALPVKLQNELRKTKEELRQVNKDISELQCRKTELEESVVRLRGELSSLTENVGGSEEFDGDNFAWSTSLKETLKQLFGINEFRSHQKAAINATMSKLDVILVMPTGGGKSLCFQLPAALSKGVTLVVSPLISLMEDQLQDLKRIGIQTEILSSSSTPQDNTRILKAMADKSVDLKLLYSTPERLSKSKRLMSQLEKIYEMGRLERIVIDEVHCCSTWGHDFRPDYKFLGVLKTQFPDTPIMGLTATATQPVIRDVQKMLNVEGCCVLKDSFFRPNLLYEVCDVPSTKKIQEIAQIIKNKFPTLSGIVYCLTIKDVEDVSKNLRACGIKAQGYHARMEAEDRTWVQQSWSKGSTQVIVATVAFGMGINKLNVRFVIHHSISKSLENYYQESGRAGRDGAAAHCILLFSFQDAFRTSALMYTENNGIKNVYNMLNYALDSTNCRKSLLARHFGDQWSSDMCNMTCDNCKIESHRKVHDIDVTNWLKDLTRILNRISSFNERATPLKLLDAWMKKGPKKFRLDDAPPPAHDKVICEKAIVKSVIHGYLKEECHFTPYSTISYLVPGRSSMLLRKEGANHSDPIQFQIGVRPTQTKRKKPTSSRDESDGDNEKPPKKIISVP